VALQSLFFRKIPQLEAAAVSDPAHIKQGARGYHVSMIQQTLIGADDARIAATELLTEHYGPTTAQAVLRYKTKRNIINFSYQKKADNIVGKMTIAALDADMAELERTISLKRIRCNFGGKPGFKD
jgi:diketogulonate reductase-like aldo/keto reductase